MGRGLTTAGLIAVSAATLLMMAWAVFPTAAGASHGTVTPPLGTPDDPWDDNIPICHATGSEGNPFVPNHPAIDANNIPAVSGHSSHTNDIIPPFYYDDDNNDATPGVLSQGVNFSGANITTWANNCVVQGTTTTQTTTQTTTPGTTTPGTTTPPTTTQPPTTEPPTTSVSGTTVVTPPSSTPAGTTVLPTRVSPPAGGTAFTGLENVVPLGAIALGLLSAGSGLMWAGARRRRRDGQDED